MFRRNIGGKSILEDSDTESDMSFDYGWGEGPPSWYADQVLEQLNSLEGEQDEELSTDDKVRFDNPKQRWKYAFSQD